MKLITILLFTLVVAVSARKLVQSRAVVSSNALTGLYGTGIYDNGTRVPLGSADPHWTLSGLVYTQQEPSDSTVYPGGVPSLPAPLYLVDIQNYQGRSGPCMNTSYNCYWVSPVQNASTPLPGSYFYYFQTNFNIDLGANLFETNFSLSISAADTVKAILINGIDTAAVGGSSDPNSAAFQQNGPNVYTTFTFDNAHGEFRSGINTLEVVVEHGYATPIAFSVGVVSSYAAFSSEFGNSNITCDDFNIYTPGSPLPAGYQDLNDIFPNIVLDQEGKITLPCVPALSDQGQFIPQVLSVTSSYYGQPICAVIVDCNVAGAGQIEATISNTNRGDQYFFVLEEICSNPGVFFGCIDSAYGRRFTNPRVGESGPVVTGEFADTIQVHYVDPYGLSSNSYNVYLVCGNQPEFNFGLVSSLLLRDALENNIQKLMNLRGKIVEVQNLLFDNAEDIPCSDIAQSTDLSQTALNFFNFLDCVGNRELSEDQFLYSSNLLLNNSTSGSGVCSS